MGLEQKFGDQIPPYVIVSHCWGEEEVTFQDMNGSKWQSMRGARKILYASQQCRADGLSYMWIDTCCIDKTSSAELSEAINSMYSWYEKAQHCYAYLEDVDVEGLDDIVDGLRASKWFTRGWTLQELIAPRSVTFYNKYWGYLGRKADLCKPLSSITSVPIEVLVDPSLGKDSSVAQRMTWAARRETTRLEDEAYCLLGIFDVNMPLLYGEGSKAFARLQEEVMKATDDHSLFAWGFRSDNSPPADGERLSEMYNLFAKSPADFLGSETIVPFPAGPNQQAHFMTNKGMRIDMPIWNSETSPQTLNGMLNCHIANDFNSFVGLQLRTTANSGILLRRWGTAQFEVIEDRVTELRAINIAKFLPPPALIEQPAGQIIIRINWSRMHSHGYTQARFISEDEEHLNPELTGAWRKLPSVPAGTFGSTQYPQKYFQSSIAKFFYDQWRDIALVVTAVFEEMEALSEGWRSGLLLERTVHIVLIGNRAAAKEFLESPDKYNPYAARIALPREMIGLDRDEMIITQKKRTPTVTDGLTSTTDTRIDRDYEQQKIVAELSEHTNLNQQTFTLEISGHLCPIVDESKMKVISILSSREYSSLTHHLHQFQNSSDQSLYSSRPFEV